MKGPLFQAGASPLARSDHNPVPDQNRTFSGAVRSAVRHDIRHKCDEYSSGDIAAGVEVRGAGYHRRRELDGKVQSVEARSSVIKTGDRTL